MKQEQEPERLGGCCQAIAHNPSPGGKFLFSPLFFAFPSHTPTVRAFLKGLSSASHLGVLCKVLPPSQNAPLAACCVFCCHPLYPCLLTSRHAALRASQPAPCSSSASPPTCSAFVLGFPSVLFQTFSPIPAPSAVALVSHTPMASGSRGRADPVEGAGLRRQPRDASQGIVITACRSAGAAGAVCPFKGRSDAVESHPRIYVCLAGSYKLPLKVDFFISHFLLHKMFITVVFLPVLLPYSIFHSYTGKLPSSSACCPLASHLSPPLGCWKAACEGSETSRPFLLGKKNPSYTLSCGWKSCWGQGWSAGHSTRGFGMRWGAWRQQGEHRQPHAAAPIHNPTCKHASK